MTEPRQELTKSSPPPAGFPSLLETLRGLILQARQRVLSAANAAQVLTYWEIGRHIVEYEQGGESRAAYGKGLLPTLAAQLTKEFGRGFDVSNLRHMRDFYLSFPIRDALRRELSWTHYRLLLRVDAAAARQWYLEEAAAQNWSSRVLERQIGSLSYERLLSNQENALPAEKPAATPVSARDFVRDPVMLEFLGLPETGRLLESTLEGALMDKLQQFLLELGTGFAFVARQQRISTETQDFYIDLVFYNYLLKSSIRSSIHTRSPGFRSLGIRYAAKGLGK
jgi:predicted nuclease of restriction endonuclease-like (RecB) superfamily